MCVAWRDKKANKPVLVMSTKVVSVMEKGKKSQSSSIYIISIWTDVTGANKWWVITDSSLDCSPTSGGKNLLLHWLLEITCSNSYILYCPSHPQEKWERPENIQSPAHRRIMPGCCNPHSKSHQQVATKQGRPRTTNPIKRVEGCKHMIEFAEKNP